MAIYVFKVSRWSCGEEQAVAIEANTLKEAIAEYEEDWGGDLLTDDWDIERVSIEKITSTSLRRETDDNN